MNNCYSNTTQQSQILKSKHHHNPGQIQWIKQKNQVMMTKVSAKVSRLLKRQQNQKTNDKIIELKRSNKHFSIYEQSHSKV